MTAEEYERIIHLFKTQLVIDAHRFGKLGQDDMKLEVERTLAIVESGVV
jgi:hypothetical protein